jgi:hypothetical protein
MQRRPLNTTRQLWTMLACARPSTLSVLAIHEEEPNAYIAPSCLIVPLPIDEFDDFKL